jgi:hypothetical protein
VKTLLASAAVLALSMTAAHAEKLLFQDRNSIQDWWYSDENPDGSLTLSTRSNDPSVMPFYLICKGRPVQYGILFQPPVQPVKSVYLYRVFNLSSDYNRASDISAPAGKNGAQPVNVSGDAIAWLLYGRDSFKINYQLPDGDLGDGHYYIRPPLNAARLFATRCVNLGVEHNPPPPLLSDGSSPLQPQSQSTAPSQSALRAACEADWRDCKNGLNDLLFNKKGHAIRAACMEASIKTLDRNWPHPRVSFQQGADYFDARSASDEMGFLKSGIVEIQDYHWKILCSYNLNTDQVTVKWDAAYYGGRR